MAGDTVQQIKDRLSIVDVVSQYVKLERSGASLKARCPFHAEKTASFHVSPERGSYHCFGCNVGGDIFSFVQAIEGLDFKGALKVLAEKAGVPLVYERPEKRDARERLFELMEAATIFYTSKLTDDVEKYLKDRGLEEATIRAFRVGWADESWDSLATHLKSKKFSDAELLEAGLAKKNERGSLTDKFRNRIMFPINDSAGRVVGFSGRTFGPHASPDAPKYLNSPETPLFHKSRVLFGFDRGKTAMRKHNFAILVEGQMDLLMSHQAGWPNTVAGSGTAFTTEHAQIIKRMTDNLVLALDADQAGIKAAGRAARAALQAGLNVKVAKLPQGLDPADLIKSEGPEAWRIAIRESKDIITFLLDVLAEHLPERDRFRRGVESAVLPFLTDVQSPIAREQYASEIAARLGVSTSAVLESVGKLPRERVREVAPEAKAAEPVNDQRERQVMAIYLWQKTKKDPALDLAAYEKSLRGALGGEVIARYEALDGAEREQLLFLAEMLYGEHAHLSREADDLVSLVARDKLRHELGEVASAIRAAEERGDEGEVERLMKQSKLLTARIAGSASSV